MLELTDNYVIVEAGIISHPAYGQLVEIVSLAQVVEKPEGKTENIITGSAYACAAIHGEGPMWVKWDFNTTGVRSLNDEESHLHL